MAIYLDGIKTDFQKSDYNYIDEGNEAEIYRYKEYALKFYKERSRKERINEDLVKYLKTIKTKRYLLPIFDITNGNSEFLGYGTLFKQHYQTLCNISFDKFLDEIKYLQEDTEILSEKRINIEDLSIDNTIYDGSIYLIDPGSFILDLENKTLSKENMEKLNTYIIEELIVGTLSTSISTKRKKELKEFLINELDSGSYGFVGEFLEQEQDNFKTLSDCSRKLLNKHL